MQERLQEFLASSFYEMKPPLFWVREEARSKAEQSI